MYSVSNLGRVKSNERIVVFCDGRKSLFRGKILKLWVNPNGYVNVHLSRNGKVETFRVHRLVLEAFVDPCPKGMECRHFPDRTRTNNNLENLQWGTISENKRDRKLHGTDNSGERNNTVKLTRLEVVKIRKVYSTGKFSHRELAEMFSVNHSTIGRLLRNQNWA